MCLNEEWKWPVSCFFDVKLHLLSCALMTQSLEAAFDGVMCPKRATHISTDVEPNNHFTIALENVNC